MFASRWKESKGFGWNRLFNSGICRYKADSPDGEFIFDGVVLPRRGRQYFDGTIWERHTAEIYLAIYVVGIKLERK